MKWAKGPTRSYHLWEIKGICHGASFKHHFLMFPNVLELTERFPEGCLSPKKVKHQNFVKCILFTERKKERKKFIKIPSAHVRVLGRLCLALWRLPTDLLITIHLHRTYVDIVPFPGVASQKESENDPSSILFALNYNRVNWTNPLETGSSLTKAFRRQTVD